MVPLLRNVALLSLLWLGDPPSAPDGKRGFGNELTINEVQKLLRSSEDEDKAFVARLFGLKSEVSLRLLQVRILYDEHGYFDLLESTAEHELADLENAFFDQLEDARTALQEDGAYPVEMARLWSDVSFALRAELAETLPRDLYEVRAGLQLLLAHRDGYADLSNREAQDVMMRIDLAAARLRAFVLDFDTLSQSETWLAEAQELEEQVLALSEIADEKKRMREFARIEIGLSARQVAAKSVLFTTRLMDKTAQQERVRDTNLEESARVLRDVLQWLPETEEGRDAPKNVQKLPKHKRYVSALRLAVSALSVDPLNAELCYHAGYASEFLYGELESLPWYDRFLALRGIRAHVASTTRGRLLTTEERRAYDSVQRQQRNPQDR